MAEAKTVAGSKLLIKVSDGAATPVFAHPCLINAARGIQFSSSSNEQRIPDCTNPDLIAWTKTYKISLTASISGAGVLNTTDNEFYFDWYKGDTSIAVRVEFSGVTAINGGGYWSGNFKLTDYGISGDIGDETQCDIKLVSHGTVTWTDAAV